MEEKTIVDAIPTEEVINAIEMVPIPKHIIDLFTKASTKLELTLAREELLKFLR